MNAHNEISEAGDVAISPKPDTVPVEIVSRWNPAKILFRAEIDASIPVFGRIKAAVLLALKRGAYLGGADLRGADLRGAYLRGAYLGGADLRGAYLRGADLGGADLGGAYLGGADLRGAYLRGAYLGGADLGGAYLGGAKITLENGDEVTLSERGFMSIGPIGSEGGTLMVYRSEDGSIFAQRGCFGPAPLDEFLIAVEDTHGDNSHGRTYRAAAEMIRAWAEAA